MTESQLQQQIISFLSTYSRRYNFIFFSVPNESLMTALMAFRVDKVTSAKLVSHFKKMGMTSGVSDLIILQDGKAYCFELKTETGKQSKEQILFQKNAENTQIKYAVIRSLKQMQDKMFEWGIVWSH